MYSCRKVGLLWFLLRGGPSSHRFGLLDCHIQFKPLTNKIKLGPVITYLYPQYRSIALLAKQATTFQEISNGRLEFRTGAGATPQYALQWWHPYGINYPKEFVRVSILREGVEVLKALWNQHQENNDASPSTYSSIRYDGKFFRINGASPFKSYTGATFTKTKIPVHSE
jgi:alkanesulfonate monooxygenase SsuD/methylene tetrahydromethanopterin reductase-like flavin-dependent oxidoreductase (luciferase family)